MFVKRCSLGVTHQEGLDETLSQSLTRRRTSYLAFFLATRFTDGPMGLVSGGAFSSGEVVSTEPDWRFIKDYDTVEFQLLEPARSRTTWIVEHEAASSYPAATC
ncbi:MAG: hypothetical protein CM15mP120_02860 [Pseudomonadota bacterium]|nr:MAG: hypothetical protein CM15mP120_02860 [Pseudomonadota bacterium]